MSASRREIFSSVLAVALAVMAPALVRAEPAVGSVSIAEPREIGREPSSRGRTREVGTDAEPAGSGRSGLIADVTELGGRIGDIARQIAADPLYLARALGPSTPAPQPPQILGRYHQDESG